MTTDNFYIIILHWTLNVANLPVPTISCRLMLSAVPGWSTTELSASNESASRIAVIL